MLYVAYWGLREPLGRSLVLPAIRELAARGVALTLVTFDKPHDLADRAGMAAQRSELEALGVRWRALRYHKRPTVPATLFDIAHGVLVGLAAPRPAVIHGRTFVGGVIGAIVALLRHVPFVYHNEGFWPDQQVEGGFWRAGSFIYRATKAIERWLYGRADGLLLLSRASQAAVTALPRVARRDPPIAIIPSCVDLERFSCEPRTTDPAALRLVYIGSLGGRYMIEPLGHLLAALLRVAPNSSLVVLSHSDHGRIRDALATTPAPRERCTIGYVSHQDMPHHLNQADVGLLFQRGGVGGESGSPTKIGEYWACGLPVAVNPGIGDADAIIRTSGVGVLLSDFSGAGYARAASAVVALTSEPGIRARCRRAAEEHYALDAAVKDQLAVYERVISRHGAER